MRSRWSSCRSRSVPFSVVAWLAVRWSTSVETVAAGMSTLDLFQVPGQRLPLGAQAFILCGFAMPYQDELLAALSAIEAQSPFRQMQTRGGYRMSVAMTNCGEVGWVSDLQGYRYSSIDPHSGAPWPAMPGVFSRLAETAAAAAGFAAFQPDACLINRYLPG